MRNSLAIAMIAGLASAATAQEFTLSIIATSDMFSSTTVTVDIVGDATMGTHMLGGGFGLSTNNSSLVTDITWMPASWSVFNTDNGYGGNGNYNQVIFGQLVIPGVPPFDIPGPGSELGNIIGSFQIDLTQPLSMLNGIDFSLVTYAPFTLEVVDINSGQAFQNNAGNLTLNGLQAPTPSALALLGLGGLAATRRRR